MVTQRTDGDVPETTSRLTVDQLQQLDEDGYVVLPNHLSPEDCDLWSQEVEDAWERDRTEQHDYIEEPGVRFVANLLRHSVMFERCATDPAVLEGIRAVLGPDVMLSTINGRRADPGYGNQPLHELDRQRGKPFRKCDAIWCLDEFTALNGTRVIPGSHLGAEHFLSRLKDPLLPHPDERIVEAPRGSVLVFVASLIHGGSTNRNDKPRRSIQTQFALAGEKPLYDWSALPSHIQEELQPESLRLLGLPAR
jgi:ectoine hydroxylase-related dioxygenase (phytanoyl-CoA dioxygenase family)